MAGKVIQTLRMSPLATALSEAELRSLANCGRLIKYGYGETILEESGLDERLFLLREGKLSLHLVVWTESGQCGGEATCEHIQKLVDELKILDIAHEMSTNLLDTEVYRTADRFVCRNSCVVPAAVLKALEVEANIFPPAQSQIEFVDASHSNP